MKKIITLAFVSFGLIGCSGIAPEAERDDSNSLLKPPFMDQDLSSIAKKRAEQQSSSDNANN